MEDPHVDQSLLLFAVDGENVAAGTGLFANRVDSKTVMTGLTATGRDQRRQGLATAAKAANLLDVKRRGATEVFTDNEEQNPTLPLNVAPGFRPHHETVGHTKAVS